MTRPALHDVTLCCIDCVQPELALRALHLSRVQCDFGASLFLTSESCAGDGIEVRRIETLRSVEAYSRFVLKELVRHVATPFVLLVQWDGWVLDGAMWEEGFRAFDYIGAPWPTLPEGQQVGNGGFSLRSRRLLATVAQDEMPRTHPEDYVLCTIWRPRLEQAGLRFADPATARRFSVEMTPDLSPNPSFGFHSIANLWRAVPPEELAALLEKVPLAGDHVQSAGLLLVRYAVQQRWGEAKLVRRRFEAEFGAAELDRTLDRVNIGTEGARMRVLVAAMDPDGRPA